MKNCSLVTHYSLLVPFFWVLTERNGSRFTVHRIKNVAGELPFAFLRGQWTEDRGQNEK